MDSDFTARIEELLVLHQAKVGTDPVPTLANIALRRETILLMSLELPEDKQANWLLIEQQFAHVDRDILRLHESMTGSVSELDEEIQFEVSELWFDVSSQLAQMLSLSREI